MEFLRQLWNGIRQAWQRLTLSARVNMSVAALATISIVAYMAVVNSRPEYVSLFDGLNPQEVPKIVEVLRAQSIPYYLSNDNQTVSVPRADVSRGKLALTEKSLPTTQGKAPGFDMFKDPDLLSNRWLQDVKYMRAVQGELQRQLDEFDFVNKSSVFIREAKDEIFTDQQKPSKAAVQLDTKRKLGRTEIDAVLHTISSFGGANLKLDDITLTTTKGEVLHAPPKDGFQGEANSRLEYANTIERQREQRVVDAFEQIGKKAIVRVSALIDNDQVTETSRTSEEGAPVSTYQTETSSNNSEGPPQGPAGASQNLPEGATGPGTATTSEKTVETITNSEPSTVETKTVRQPGRVRRYQVSAIIQGTTKEVTDANGAKTTQYAGLTAEERTKYEDFIRGAVGMGEEETAVVVSDMPFDMAALTDVQKATEAVRRAEMTDLMVKWGSTGGKLALILFGFLMVRRILRRLYIVPADIEEEQAAAAEAAEMPSASPEDLRREEVLAELSRLSQEQPDAVAAILRSWLAEEEE